MDGPRVGLLNIGEEDMKGHEIVQAAHALLGASGLNYIGFVEGDDIFSGDVDVVVTDGFTGNVALKTMEGAAQVSSPTACARSSRRRSLEQARGARRASGAEASGRRAGSSPIQRRVHGGLERYRGKKPRRRGQRRVRTRNCACGASLRAAD